MSGVWRGFVDQRKNKYGRAEADMLRKGGLAGAKQENFVLFMSVSRNKMFRQRVISPPITVPQMKELPQRV